MKKVKYSCGARTGLLLTATLATTGMVIFFLLQENTDVESRLAELEATKRKLIELEDENLALRRKVADARNVPNAATTLAPRSPTVPLEPKLASSSSSSTPLAVTMDWSQDGMYFALSNYRALEAVLTLHSAADVEVDIVAPSYGDWYRHGNLISKRYFDKYKKRGYGVQVHRIDPDSAPRRSKGDGKSWWHVRGPVFKESLRDAISNYNIEVRLPSAAMLWLRLARMQVRGGIFLDFTTLLLKPAEGHRGYSIAPPGCIAALTSDARLPPMVLAFNQNDPVLECALKELESTCKLAGKADVQCPVLDVDRLLSSCFSRFSVANSLEHAVAWLCESQSLLDAPVEDPAVGAALQGRLALWLGPRAMDGMWQRAVEGSVSAALQEQAKKGLTRYAHPSQNAADSKCRVRCNHYLPVPLGKSSGKPHEARASAENCAPQVIVPGTRKGASSFIFHFLAQHPQFVHPVDGSGFKETAAYLHMYDKGRRPNFFPHLEENDNFITGDGHVDLMMTENTPERIQADNPAAKAIFILREPAERAYSDYKYVYNAFRDKGKSFDTAAREAVSNLEKCLGADGAADEAATAKKFWRCHDWEQEIVKRGM